MTLINSAKFTAVLDANVLFPLNVRDLLLTFAENGLYTVKWSSKLLEEMFGVFEKKRFPLNETEKEIQIKMYNKAFPDALVENYQKLIPSIELPDENDRHVVASAIKCNANVIVTYNLKDFPNDYLKTLGLTAIHPDPFIADMIDLSPKKCVEALTEMILRRDCPPITVNEFLQRINKNNNLKETVKEFKKYLSISHD